MPINGHAGNIARKALTDELRTGRTVQLPVRTNSMSPTLLRGDSLEIAPADVSHLHCGDIVLVDCGDEWLVHRLMSTRSVRRHRVAITAGDSLRGLDPPFPLSDVIGRVVGIERAGAHVPIAPAPAARQDVHLLLLSFPGIPDGPAPQRDALIEMAKEEGLAPLIHYHGSGSVEEQQRPAFEREYVALLGRNTLFLRELSRVANALAGIDFILLKGAYLAASVYPSPGLRQFGDIDMLIRPADFRNVHGRLVAGSYAPAPGQTVPDGEPSTSPYLNSVSYRNRNAGPSLHLHWHLTNSILPKYTDCRVDMDEIWRRSSPGSGNWLEMCPEHTVMHLAEHALRHSFDRLILVRDIAEVINRFDGRIDWSLLVNHSTRFGLTAPVYYGLLMVARKTGTPVPPNVLANLKPKRPGLSARLFQMLLMRDVRHPELCNLAYLGNTPSTSTKIGFLWSVLFPPKAVLAHAYHRKEADIGPALYLSRIRRGLRAAARCVFT